MSVTEIEDAVVQYLGLAGKDWADTTVNVSEDKLKTLCMELKKIFVIPAHFASNKGLGKSTENSVWKEPYFGDYNIVMSHIRNIREKIEDNPSKPIYIQTVWGVGYRFNKNGR